MQTIPEDIQRWVNLSQKELEMEKLRRMESEKALSSFSSNYNSQESSNLVEYQLELARELDDIYHLLSGHVKVRVQGRGEQWSEPTDDRLKIFSKNGVDQIMNVLRWWVNKNTLLSNYDEKTIIWKMKDFGHELNDLIMNAYEIFFFYPTPEQLFEKYCKIVKDNGIIISETELYKKCIDWSDKELQNKMRHYPMLIKAIMDCVHSTYLRALRGDERRTLRQFISVSQTNNQSDQAPQPQKKGGILSFLKP